MSTSRLSSLISAAAVQASPIALTSLSVSGVVVFHRHPATLSALRIVDVGIGNRKMAESLSGPCRGPSSDVAARYAASVTALRHAANGPPPDGMTRANPPAITALCDPGLGDAVHAEGDHASGCRQRDEFVVRMMYMNDTATTTTQTVTIVPDRHGDLCVHAAGCRDIRPNKYQVRNGYNVEVASLDDITFAVWGESGVATDDYPGALADDWANDLEIGPTRSPTTRACWRSSPA